MRVFAHVERQGMLSNTASLNVNKCQITCDRHPSQTGINVEEFCLPNLYLLYLTF
jgi:hypothetical protein